jgi:copper chaperone
LHQRKKELSMVTYRIADMTCGHCAGTIARALAGVDKGARVEVDVARKLVSVTSGAPEDELAEAIREAGYTPEKVPPAPREQPVSGSGCGCGCGPRAASAVAVPQSMASSSKSCCG